MAAPTPLPPFPGPNSTTTNEFPQSFSLPLQQSGATHAIDVDTGNDAEVDTFSDRDSSYSSTGPSLTASLTSSYFDYSYENGRRYASDRFPKADYFLPNDDDEQERLNLYHHLFLLIGGGRLYTAPLEKPQMVLDVGTGTGIWAIDFANDHEQAKVIGVDISPIQPRLVPPNCVFEVDDMEENWVWPANFFDYIHMRTLSGSIQDWETLLLQAYKHMVEPESLPFPRYRPLGGFLGEFITGNPVTMRNCGPTTAFHALESFIHLQPSGILEFQDYGCEAFFHTGKPITGCGTPLAQYMDLIVEAAEQLGRPLLIARSMKQMMRNAGFVDIHEQTGIWPIGDWPKDRQFKEIGTWARQGFLDSLEPFCTQLLKKGLNWKVKEVKELCDRVQKDLDKGSENRYYFQAWFIWGRKPNL